MIPDYLIHWTDQIRQKARAQQKQRNIAMHWRDDLEGTTYAQCMKRRKRMNAEKGTKQFQAEQMLDAWSKQISEMHGQILN